MGYPIPTRHGFGTEVGESFLNQVGVGLGRTRPKPTMLPSLIVVLSPLRQPRSELSPWRYLTIYYVVKQTNLYTRCSYLSINLDYSFFINQNECFKFTWIFFLFWIRKFFLNPNFKTMAMLIDLPNQMLSVQLLILIWLTILI